MMENLQALPTQGLSMLTHNHWNIIYHLCGHHTIKLYTTLLIFISSGVQGFSDITFYSTSPRPPSATCISRQAPSNLAIQMKNGVLGKGLCSVTEQRVCCLWLSGPFCHLPLSMLVLNQLLRTEGKELLCSLSSTLLPPLLLLQQLVNTPQGKLNGD